MNNTAGNTTDHQLDLFYNTTHLNGSALREKRIAAGRQNRMILDFFNGNPEGFFTPFEVQNYANLKATPITSIRRALNTLTGAGLLVKTEHMRAGEYGTLNHTWKLNK